MAKDASGIAKAGLTTGIIGTTLGALNSNGCGNGILGNLFGNNCGCAGKNVGAVAGYAAETYTGSLQARIAQLEAENMLTRTAEKFISKLWQTIKAFAMKFLFI